MSRSHHEEHLQIGRYIRDIVFAASDGIVTTFSVVAGVVGAQLSPIVILIIGAANILADGFSMAAGNYLGTKSERELYRREEAIELKEIKEKPEIELAEIKDILHNKGYRGQKLETMAKLITENKQYWVDFMMHEEMGLSIPNENSGLPQAVITFVSFAIAGTIPLLPYLFQTGQSAFRYAVIITFVTLFVVGALRTFFSQRSWLYLGLEMLLIGGSAATLAYVVGYALRFIVAS